MWGNPTHLGNIIRPRNDLTAFSNQKKKKKVPLPHNELIVGVRKSINWGPGSATRLKKEKSVPHPRILSGACPERTVSATLRHCAAWPVSGRQWRAPLLYSMYPRLSRPAIRRLFSLSSHSLLTHSVHQSILSCLSSSHFSLFLLLLWVHYRERHPDQLPRATRHRWTPIVMFSKLPRRSSRGFVRQLFD